MKKKEKRYIIRKYIVAKSVHDAIRKEKKEPVDDCWLDDDWKREDTIRGFEK